MSLRQSEKSPGNGTPQFRWSEAICFTDPLCMAGSVGSGDVAGQLEPSPSNTEPRDGLVIRAMRAHQDVAANPDVFRPVAEALVAEARQARHPEALALALRALALAEQSRLNDATALALLDEACAIARRRRLRATLADLLMSRAAVQQELGRFP